MSLQPTTLSVVNREEMTPEEQVARSKAWKAELRSTPDGEAEYQEMCQRAIEAAKKLATRRSA
jgi:hypothetical protein